MTGGVIPWCAWRSPWSQWLDWAYPQQPFGYAWAIQMPVDGDAVSAQGVVALFRDKVCREIDLIPEGLRRYVVSNPFEYDDGDCLEIVLREQDGQWVLADEGTTFMRLAYDIEEASLHRGGRRKIIANVLKAFGVDDRDGELVLAVPEDQFGNALFSFVQAILKINDVTYLTRERVRSMFREDSEASLPVEH